MCELFMNESDHAHSITRSCLFFPSILYFLQELDVSSYMVEYLRVGCYEFRVTSQANLKNRIERWLRSTK